MTKTDKLKYFFSLRYAGENENIVNFGVCSKCKKINTGYGWCNACDPGEFLAKSTSGNIEIDKIIAERQRKTMHNYDNLEWISYDRFIDIKMIGEESFAKIYSATCLDDETNFN